MHKPVRFRDSGPEVEKLQFALSRLGFSPGPIDGKFGFLTEEALLAFQRTYSLKPDALAGARVWQLLELRELPILQFPQVLLRGQEPKELEARYQLSPGTLGKVNRVGAKYPGQVLFIPQRKVVVLWDPSVEPISKLNLQTTFVAISGWRLSEELLWTGKEKIADLVKLTKKPCLAAVKLGSWSILAQRKLWPRRIGAICQGLRRNGLQGVLLELRQGQGSWRRRLVHFLGALRAELEKKGLSLYLKLPALRKEEPTSDGNWSLDFRALGAIATAVVLDLSSGEEGFLFSSWVEISLRYAESVIPPWKILPLFSSTYSTGETKQLLSAKEGERLLAMVLYRRLGGIALCSGERLHTERYFLVEGTIAREFDESYSVSQS